ncbi:MAG: HRDC domain-containing protein [Candidatus Thiodiazotropha taylori]
MLLRKLRKAAKTRTRKAASDESIKPIDQQIWEALRSLRLELAEEQGVPAYMIFHDATLMEMMERRPQTLDQLAQVSGVGKRKLESYGAQFLDCINSHSNPPDDQGDTISLTVDLLKEGCSVERIAQQRQLTLATVYSHLATAIEHRGLPLGEVLSLSSEHLKSVRYAFETVGLDGRLKPVYEALEGSYDYGELRCIQASLNGETN